MSDGFLVRWAESKLELTQGPVGCAQTEEAFHDLKTPHDQQRNILRHGVPWAEWKAAALNRLFQEQGVTGQPGRITAATIQHGEAGCKPVDSIAQLERPMSRAEAPGR